VKPKIQHRKRPPVNARRLQLLRELYEVDRGELLLTVIETIMFYSNCRRDARVVVPENILESPEQTRNMVSNFIDAIRSMNAERRMS